MDYRGAFPTGEERGLQQYVGALRTDGGEDDALTDLQLHTIEMEQVSLK